MLVTVTHTETDGHWPASWSQARARALGRWLEYAARQLGLSDWTVLVDLSNPADDDTHASVLIHPAQRAAELFIHERFLTLTARQQRHTLVHELLHLHLNPIEHTSTAALTGTLADDLLEMHSRTLHHEIEWRADMLAAVLAPTVTLPGVSDGQVTAAGSPPASVRKASSLLAVDGR